MIRKTYSAHTVRNIPTYHCIKFIVPRQRHMASSRDPFPDKVHDQCDAESREYHQLIRATLCVVATLGVTETSGTSCWNVATVQEALALLSSIQADPPLTPFDAVTVKT